MLLEEGAAVDNTLEGADEGGGGSSIHDTGTLGARGGVPGRNITNTLQGHGQRTHPTLAWDITSSFKMFQASSTAVFPAQKLLVTFKMSQVM